MKLLTLNVRSNPVMPESRVRHDVRRAKRHADVIVWQEIAADPAYYRDAVANLGKRWASCHLDLDIPISWRDDRWELVADGRKRAHKGKAKASPNRWIAWVVLRHRKHPARVVVVFNTHFVSGAWNQKRKIAKLWRKGKWVVHFRKHRRIVRRFRRRGFTSVGAGDFNRLRVAKFHRKQRWLNDEGIDKVWVLTGRGRKAPRIAVRNVRHIVRGWFTDHPGILAVFAIK